MKGFAIPLPKELAEALLKQNSSELEPTIYPLSEDSQLCYAAFRCTMQKLEAQHKVLVSKLKALEQEGNDTNERFWISLETLEPRTAGRNVRVTDNALGFQLYKEEQNTPKPPQWVAELLAQEAPVEGEVVEKTEEE